MQIETKMEAEPDKTWDYKLKTITRGKGEQCIDKRVNHQEDVPITNMYVPNNKTPK